jgi:DNA-binding CsgD family transcriptional regulator
MSLVVQGALGDAEAEARRALLATEGRPWVGRPLAIAALCESLCAQGQLDEAEALLQTCDEPDLAPWTIEGRALLEQRGRLRVMQARPVEALADLLLAGQHAEEVGVDNPAVTSWRAGAVEALRAQHRIDQASVLAKENLAKAELVGTRWAIGSATRTLAAVSPLGDRPGLLRGAVTLLEETPARLDRASALVDLGAALHRLGESTESARDSLRQGADLALQCGAAPLVSFAESVLRQTGARPRRIALTGADALTSGEQRVVTLAVSGHTNAEISKTLFVSEKTVEGHLRRAYRKLGIRSRRDLPPTIPAQPEPGSGHPSANGSGKVPDLIGEKRDLRSGAPNRSSRPSPDREPPDPQWLDGENLRVCHLARKGCGPRKAQPLKVKSGCHPFGASRTLSPSLPVSERLADPHARLHHFAEARMADEEERDDHGRQAVPPRTRGPHAVIISGGRSIGSRRPTRSWSEGFMAIDDECSALEILTRQLADQAFAKVILATDDPAPVLHALHLDRSPAGLTIGHLCEPAFAGTIFPVLTMLDELPGHFIVLTGIVLAGLDYADLLATHERSGAVMTVATYHREHPLGIGATDVPDQDFDSFPGRSVLRCSVSMGVFAVSRDALLPYRAGLPLDFDELMLDLVDRGTPPATYRFSGSWLEDSPRERLTPERHATVTRASSM